MNQDTFDKSEVRDNEQLISLQSTSITSETPSTAFKETTYKTLSIETLVALCSREIDGYRRDKISNDAYGLELLRRAIVQEEEEAWIGVNHCFNGLVRAWLHRHPKRDVAFRFDSEENYVAQTFERFWQATALTRHVEFKTLAAALQYLHASLNGVILDTIRGYARSREILLSALSEDGELETENLPDTIDIWDTLQAIFSDKREKRLAYLLFHCGLKPREIMRFCPQEWSDVQEIYRLKRNIMERLLRNADQLRWQLG
jgi:hypothetical protein